MQHEPALYGIESSVDDPSLVEKRTSLIHSAALILHKTNMIRYDHPSGTFHATHLPPIPSHHYISHMSISTYNQHLCSTMEHIHPFPVSSSSHQSPQLPIHQEERLQVTKLLQKVPLPIKEGGDEPSAKVNALLQAHISQLALEAFAMIADIIHVPQSAGRVWKAMYEICLHLPSSPLLSSSS